MVSWDDVRSEGRSGPDRPYLKMAMFMLFAEALHYPGSATGGNSFWGVSPLVAGGEFIW